MSYTSSSPQSTLGQQTGDHPLNQGLLVRWGNLSVALICLAGAVFVLFQGLYSAYYYYANFGPAIVWKNVRGPLALEIVLLLITLITAWNAYDNWRRRLLVFQDGLLFVDRRGKQEWRWDEIQCLRYRITRRSSLLFSSRLDHRYIVYKQDGRSITIDSRFQNAGQLGEKIRRQIFPRLYDQINREFCSGKPVIFGEVTLSFTEGIKIGKTAYSWASIKSCELEQGSLKINIEDAGKASQLRIPGYDIPNLDVFLTILSEFILSDKKPA